MSVIISTDDLEHICPNCNGTSHVTIENEFPKFGFLCGDLVNDTGFITTQNGNDDGPIFFPPEGATSVLSPFTFTIPARKLFTIQTFPPQPVHPPSPCYEVRVTFPPVPTVPTDPIRVNTWGISTAGVIQEGNTVLHNQFTRFVPLGPF